MLRHLLQRIEHQSALHVVCKAEQEQKLTVPFIQLETSIGLMNNKLLKRNNHDGVYPGDTVILSGKSGSGKTFILSHFVDSATKQVVYIDLEHQYGSTRTQQEHRPPHVIRPRSDLDLVGLIYKLEQWFHDNNGRVGWVIIDGEWPNVSLKWKLVERVKQLQYSWPFALIYTTRTFATTTTLDSTQRTYRFDCYKQDQTIGLKLIPPFSISHPYSTLDLDAMITSI
ncbi:hypothetical protein BC941DRAFT_432942, partial [Chlamydoabsidia padenii]